MSVSPYFIIAVSVAPPSGFLRPRSQKRPVISKARQEPRVQAHVHLMVARLSETVALSYHQPQAL